MASAAEYELATNGGAGGATGSGGARTQKRKTGAGAMIDDGNGGTKRRKKLDISPEMTSRQLPLDPPSLSYSTSTTSIAPKPIRRTNISTTATTTSKVEEELSPEVGVGLVLMEDEEGLGEGEDDVDGQTYCYCHRVSFGEMIGCDGNECDREWVRSSLLHSLFSFSRSASLDRRTESVAQFHLACVGLLSIPKGRWFCEECRVRLLFPFPPTASLIPLYDSERHRTRRRNEDDVPLLPSLLSLLRSFVCVTVIIRLSNDEEVTRPHQLER